MIDVPPSSLRVGDSGGVMGPSLSMQSESRFVRDPKRLDRLSMLGLGKEVDRNE